MWLVSVEGGHAFYGGARRTALPLTSIPTPQRHYRQEFSMKRTILLAAAAAIACMWPQFAGASTPDACKIVSTADAGSMLGTPVTAVTTRAIGDSISCEYHTSSLSRLAVTTVPFKTPAAAKSQFRAMISSPMNQVAPSESIAGVGDQAQRLGPSIYVLKGVNIYVFVLIGKDANGAGALKTIALAKASIARIK
jgi:hypothetical protein